MFDMPWIWGEAILPRHSFPTALRDDGCLRAYWDVMDQCGALRAT